MKKTISLLMSLIILTGALVVFPSTITASAKAYKYVTTTKTYKIDGKVIFKLKLKRAKLTSKTKGAKKSTNSSRNSRQSLRTNIGNGRKKLITEEPKISPIIIIQR